MKLTRSLHLTVATLLLVLLHSGAPTASVAEPGDASPKACIDGEGPGWRSLGIEDFTDVNCDPDTFVWENGFVQCTGIPVGVIRSVKEYKNFELVLEWKHLKPAGNSGVFVWATGESMEGLERGKLPHGIEIQILDHGYAEQYEERHGKPGDWFTTHGDVFAVGDSRMDPFPPLSPNGSRSFPSKNLSHGAGEWNLYYIRAVNGEVRLWVNGGEVSGGTACEPAQGYLCLESEGSPIEFRNIRIREIP